MKQKKLFSLLLLALPAAVWAQTLNNALLTPSPIMPTANQTLVRNWNDQWVVSYHVNANGSYFSCTDYSDFYMNYSMPLSPSYFTVLIPPNYNVRDMEIVDDYVFFCGHKRTGSYPGTYVDEGIVGYFDLNTFISGTFDPTIIDVGCVIFLSKMAAYRTSVGYNIAAVGSNSNSPVPPYSLPNNSTVVEISDVTGTPSCMYAIIDLSLANNENIEDVVYTGQYVAFVGEEKSSTTRLYHVRVMDNPASLPASVSGDDIHFFASMPSSTEVNGHVISAVIDAETIALTYVYHDMTLNTDETRLRVIGLSSNPPTNINSQAIPKDRKEEPLEMIYSPTDDVLVLLQNVKYIVDDHPQFVFLDPFNTTSYTANLIFFKNGEMNNSLDLFNANNFVSVGNDNNTYLQVITSPTLPLCPELDKVKVEELKNDSTVSVFDPLNWQPWAVITYPLMVPPTSTILDSWNDRCAY